MVLHMFQTLSQISELTHKKVLFFLNHQNNEIGLNIQLLLACPFFLQDKILAKMAFFNLGWPW